MPPELWMFLLVSWSHKRVLHLYYFTFDSYLWDLHDLNVFFCSVYSGYTLLRDPHYNKGLAFSEKERDAHYLRGLLPPAIFTQELQVSLNGILTVEAHMFDFISQIRCLLLTCMWHSIIGEEVDAESETVQSSLATIRGYDGSSGTFILMMILCSL